jgi:8-oxo-dGTP diphosphatase
MPSSNLIQTPAIARTIRIAAAIITNANGQMLVVRKRNTQAFIQPGGKINPGESPTQALARELKEELNCVLGKTKFAGQFSAPAVNELQHTVIAEIYWVQIEGVPAPSAEIGEMAWINPADPGPIPLAPLTRDFVLPLAKVMRDEAAVATIEGTVAKR